MSVQATFSATLVDEWARLGVTDAVVCPGSRSTPRRSRWLIDSRFMSASTSARGIFRTGYGDRDGEAACICVRRHTRRGAVPSRRRGAPCPGAAHRLHGDRPPELHDTSHRRPLRRPVSTVPLLAGPPHPGSTEGQEETWRPLAAHAFAEAAHGPSGPGPVHLNLEFREPLIGAGAPLPPAPPCGRRPTRRTGAGTGHRHPGGASTRSGADHRGWLGPRAAAPGTRCVLALADRLGWPVLADPLSGARVEGTIAAADAIVRTEPPLPDCLVMLGAPWLSRALGTYVSTPPVPVRGSSSSIRGGSGPIRPEWPRSSTSVRPRTGSRPPPRRRSGAIPSGSPPGGPRETRAQAASPRCWGRT